MKPKSLALCLIMLGCAPTKPTAFVEGRARAERDYSSGRYQRAAQDWQKAARAADRATDREEAMYRVATSKQRAGDIEGARNAYTELLRAFPKGSRAARAAYELASLELDAHHEEAALGLFVRVMEEYPESGIAGRALERCLVSILGDAGVDEKLGFLATLSDIESPELDEEIGYKRARLLLDNKRLPQAKQEFLRVAERYPYPQGAYWDDALWYAADIERRLHHPDAALSLLRRMLNERETAHFQGSYQRPRYAQAQFRIAEIYRDDLERPEIALSEFRRVFTEHPTSLLRDDALWQEALLAHDQGLGSRACDAIQHLIQSLPESRFVGCARRLCPRVAVPGARPCRRYIERTLESTSRAERSHEVEGEPQSSK